MSDEFTLKIKRFDRLDARLGRNVNHDSRSRRFAAPARDPRTLTSVRHEVLVPIMDQGNVGSCTGHAATAAAGSAFDWPNGLTADSAHGFAVGLYSEATALDPWPGIFQPDDTGSDGLSVAKALQQRGLISGYQHALSLEAALAALAERPTIVGTSWLASMSEPGADGKLTVSGAVDGGHEYCLDQLDVENRRVWMRNSWGDSWGVQGRAWMTFDDLGKLLADDGDCTVLIPLSMPAPQPAPVPAPTPAPSPAPTPVAPARPAEDAMLAVALTKFVHANACPQYVRQAAKAWLATIPKGVKR